MLPRNARQAGVRSTGIGDEVPLEVSHDRVHADALISCRDGLGALKQNLLADVEGREERERSTRAKGVEQQRRLLGRARSELDQRVDPGQGGDLRREVLEDRAFGAASGSTRAGA